MWRKEIKVNERTNNKRNERDLLKIRRVTENERNEKKIYSVGLHLKNVSFNSTTILLLKISSSRTVEQTRRVFKSLLKKPFISVLIPIKINKKIFIKVVQKNYF